ncbi:hypothetical protein AVEN_255280-1 [Araneus ventricosus]|uniref:Uncharacterized protein n=1 Tax=Araneus ventricosus TaxID=182803 RepID=A0A4Y2B9Y1_ARAVE|nr:hypothetical protein AVEN_255280-1 [Araneus ventricosus]
MNWTRRSCINAGSDVETHFNITDSNQTNRIQTEIQSCLNSRLDPHLYLKKSSVQSLMRRLKGITLLWIVKGGGRVKSQPTAFPSHISAEGEITAVSAPGRSGPSVGLRACELASQDVILHPRLSRLLWRVTEVFLSEIAGPEISQSLLAKYL